MIYLLTKRAFDIIFSFLSLVLLCIPMIVTAVFIKLTSKGPVFYLSDRIGLNNTVFKMFKYRTMLINTPVVATHLLKEPQSYVTSIGRVLRKYSIDELPQLINILKGDMSFTGPRPALFNQYDLIEFRTKKNVHTLIPGVTGWAQINGRDELSIPVKVEFDEYYLKNKSFLLDAKILFITAFKVLNKEGVKH
jgi:O-antigen biosynthesis protein WbqP